MIMQAVHIVSQQTEHWDLSIIDVLSLFERDFWNKCSKRWY